MDGGTYLGTSMRDSDFAARVTLLCELTGEELAKLGAEHTVRDEFSLLADLAGHFESLWIAYELAIHPSAICLIQPPSNMNQARPSRFIHSKAPLNVVQIRYARTHLALRR
jgi:hypothetical protein